MFDFVIEGGEGVAELRRTMLEDNYRPVWGWMKSTGGRYCLEARSGGGLVHRNTNRFWLPSGESSIFPLKWFEEVSSFQSFIFPDAQEDTAVPEESRKFIQSE